MILTNKEREDINRDIEIKMLKDDILYRRLVLNYLFNIDLSLKQISERLK